MELYLLAFQVVLLESKEFIQFDGEVTASSFKEAKNIADNLGKQLVNVMTDKGHATMFLGSVVTLPVLVVD